MEFDEQFLMALAHGDKSATDEMNKLPTSVKMGLALTVDEIRQDKGIVPQTTGFRVFAEQPVRDRDAEVAESIKRMLEQKRKNEEEARERHEAFVKQQTEMAIQRSRLGLPSQKQVIRLG